MFTKVESGPSVMTPAVNIQDLDKQPSLEVASITRLSIVRSVKERINAVSVVLHVISIQLSNRNWHLPCQLLHLVCWQRVPAYASPKLSDWFQLVERIVVAMTAIGSVIRFSLSVTCTLMVPACGPSLEKWRERKWYRCNEERHSLTSKQSQLHELQIRYTSLQEWDGYYPWSQSSQILNFNREN